MPALQHIAGHDQPARPWRNGGGSTRELFTWPGGAGPWQLRISVADIDCDGPFSAYPGVDRWFAVLQGAGVRLALPGAAPADLHAGSPPVAFAGEAAPGCRLIGGPTRDLNLMLQRGAGQAAMLPVQANEPWLHAAPLRALFTTGALGLSIDGRAPQPVAAWSLALGLSAAGQAWSVARLPAGTRALWLSFQPEAGKP